MDLSIMVLRHEPEDPVSAMNCVSLPGNYGKTLVSLVER